HASYSIHHDLDYNYERLEFLGDSVLSLIVSEYIYKKYPQYEEGDLTKLRSNFVCQNALIYYSHKLGLQEYLKVSEVESNLTKNEVLSITADLFESFLGAIFIDKGMEFAKEFVSNAIFKYIDQERVFFEDYKSSMKEYGDANEIKITYEVLKEYGVPHDKTFIMACLVDGKQMGVGRGKNKKEAEQSAAKGAMRKLRIGRK
ncbi:MAG: ribonuclease III, partial [Methanobrevibacter sp.]|nr:ribonuclease III [Methanobrevibacter sp.]